MTRSSYPVACVVPAYDAAATVGAVVDGIRAAVPAARVIVVDDGSRDDTAAVAARRGVDVLRFERNRGKGAALRAGIARAVGYDARAVVTLDADGQHDAAYLPVLVSALDHADVAIGVRARRGTRMPAHRRFTNAASSRAISFCAGVRVPDAQSGYRAMRAEVASSVDGDGDRYEYETSFLIRAARRGFRIAAVPVPTIYAGAASHFHGFDDAMLVMRTIWRHRPGGAA